MTSLNSPSRDSVDLVTLHERRRAVRMLLRRPLLTADGGRAAELVLDVRLPEGYKVNDDASSSVTLADKGGGSLLQSGERVDLTGATFPISIPIELREGVGTVTADLALVWCRTDAEGLCLLERTLFEIPLEVAAEGPSASIRVRLDLTAPVG